MIPMIPTGECISLQVQDMRYMSYYSWISVYDVQGVYSMRKGVYLLPTVGPKTSRICPRFISRIAMSVRTASSSLPSRVYSRGEGELGN